jgi:hypothetical protein
MITQEKLWLKGLLVLLVVFSLGGVTGAALDGLYRSRTNAALQLTAGRDARDNFESLKRELNLSTEQSRAIKSILDEMRNDYGAICADVRPRYDELRERARGRMRTLLTPDQQQRFDSIVIKDDCSSCPFIKK